MPGKHHIEIHVRPEFRAENSEEGRYVFVYHVSIKNSGLMSVQLLRRHWFIVDGNEHLEEVVGDGVVGEQPLLNPGDEYAYSSFCVLGTPVGCMHGHYTFIDEQGLEFPEDIPIFTLADILSVQ